MTPREKAIELVEKFESSECALKVVEQILQVADEFVTDRWRRKFISIYFNDVVTEIEKL